MLRTRAAVNAARDELSDLDAQLAAEIAVLNEKQAEIKRLEEELAGIRAKITDSTARITEITDSNATLQTRLAELQERQADEQASAEVVSLADRRAQKAAEDAEETEQITLANLQKNKEIMTEAGITPDELLDVISLLAQTYRMRKDAGDAGVSSFEARKIEREAYDKLDDLQARMLDTGYAINTKGLEEYAHKLYEETEAQVDKLTDGIMDIAARQQAEELIKDPAGNEIWKGDVRNIKAMTIGQFTTAIDSLEYHNHHIERGIMLAKRYGHGSDVMEGERLLAIKHEKEGFDGADADDRAAWIADMENLSAGMMERERLVAEIDEQEALEEKHRNDLSPLPSQYARETSAKLRKQLAELDYNIESRVITDEDIEVYRKSGSASEASEHFAKQYFEKNIYAGSVFEQRVAEEASRRSLEKWRNSELYRFFAEVGESLGSDGYTFHDRQDGAGETYRKKVGAGEIVIGPDRDYDKEKDTLNLVVSYYSDARRGEENERLLRMYPKDAPVYEAVADILAFERRFRTQVDPADVPAYGSLFNDPANDSIKYDLTAINSRIRDMIKEGKKSGKLPKQLKTSVRKSGYRSIYIDIKDIPDSIPMFNPAYLQWQQDNPNEMSYMGAPSSFSREYNALVNYLKALGEAWNYNNSDPMTDYFDYNFGLDVSATSDLKEAQREKGLAQLALAKERGLEPSVINRLTYNGTRILKMEVTSTKADNPNVPTGYTVHFEDGQSFRVKSNNDDPYGDWLDEEQAADLAIAEYNRMNDDPITDEDQAISAAIAAQQDKEAENKADATTEAPGEPEAGDNVADQEGVVTPDGEDNHSVSEPEAEPVASNEPAEVTELQGIVNGDMDSDLTAMLETITRANEALGEDHKDLVEAAFAHWMELDGKR